MTVAWASQTGSPLYADVDFVVTMEKVWGEGLGRGFLLSPHRGPVWVSCLHHQTCLADIMQDITTSDYHTMAASGGSDGAVLLSNYLTGFRRRRRRV